MLVPGAGEPNYDSYVADPFQSYKARREQEVAQLLDKLPPESITLDPSSVAAVRPAPHAHPSNMGLGFRVEHGLCLLLGGPVVSGK
jgi:BING4CT (NUC141) domain